MNKICTSIEQSKTLSEILPIESADMARFGKENIDISSGDNVIMTNYILAKKKFSVCGEIPINPCWSLTALLSVIPQEIFDGQYILNITEGIGNRWIITYDHREDSNHSYYGLFSGADDLVDACVAMIEKLYKHKML